jgi:diguanylate cyclase (GGDEF)-like protein/PAS domain S-box-containing protein
MVGNARAGAKRGDMSQSKNNAEWERLLQAQKETERLLREQKLQLDAALNNMLQGLCLFGADEKIALFNQRYAEMMNLPGQDLLGLSLPALMRRRKASGLFVGDPESISDEVLAGMRSGLPVTKILESADGRALRCVNQPMPNGGWVATFEDITEQRAFEKERERQREFLDQILDNVPAMIVVKDAVERKFVHANRAAEAFWGFSRNEAIGKTLYELFPHGKAEAIDNADVEALKSGKAVVREAHPSLVLPGDKRLVTSKRDTIYDADGKPSLLVSVVEDVTDRKRLEQDRNRDREFLNQIIENVPTTIAVKDVHSRRYVLINEAGVEHFGVPRDQIIGRTAHDIFFKETADVISRHDDELMESEGYKFFEEYSLHTRTHGRRYVTSKKLIIRDSAGQPQYLLGMIEDVTDRKQSEERIAHLAHYDALTDLPNRLFFREQLEQALKRVRRGEQLAVLYLDLDKFKSVNDTLGHQGGDELLKAVAERLRSCLRETDIVARLGGDEFAIVQTSVGRLSDVTDLVKRIHDAVRASYELLGHQLTTDTSIGIAMAPNDGSEPDQLLKNADLAMYGAKADGRGTYRFFESEMDARMKARRSLEFDLRQAVMCGEFELHYQPLLNIRDNNIAACEALLRWNHPTRGMVSPAEFIPVAEDTGVINPLGEWVLRTACAEAARWPSDVTVTVNVSPVQFKSENLVQTVISALATSGLPAKRLELEITESVLLGDDEKTLLMLHQLKELGVRIALDDFGTGYSSLNYLRRFPFDKIKIDRSFIKDVAEKDGSWSIVQAVVSIAKSRNIVTTAEGVETQEQLDLLRVLGCTEMQGYLFSKPKPAADIIRLLMPRHAKKSVA